MSPGDKGYVWTFRLAIPAHRAGDIAPLAQILERNRALDAAREKTAHWFLERLHLGAHDVASAARDPFSIDEIRAELRRFHSVSGGTRVTFGGIPKPEETPGFRRTPAPPPPAVDNAWVLVVLIVGIGADREHLSEVSDAEAALTRVRTNEPPLAVKYVAFEVLQPKQDQYFTNAHIQKFFAKD
ncbi:MAG: hypothetical protein IPK60_03585 [Sandaracinaceae bacterium]|nr:hypothetical protein [Sandaracinaceae bacterium]